jgi:hypothetical protein
VTIQAVVGRKKRLVLQDEDKSWTESYKHVKDEKEIGKIPL